MPQVELTENVFIAAKRRAVEQGYTSVDEFISELVSDELVGPLDVRSLFTPDRLAKIDAAVEEVKAGKTLTLEDLDGEILKWKMQTSQEHRR